MSSDRSFTCTECGGKCKGIKPIMGVVTCPECGNMVQNFGVGLSGKNKKSPNRNDILESRRDKAQPIQPRITSSDRAKSNLWRIVRKAVSAKPQIIKETRVFVASLIVGFILNFLAGGLGLLSDQEKLESIKSTEQSDYGRLGRDRERGNHSSTDVTVEIIRKKDGAKAVVILFMPYLIILAGRLSTWAISEAKPTLEEKPNE